MHYHPDKVLITAESRPNDGILLFKTQEILLTSDSRSLPQRKQLGAVLIDSHPLSRWSEDQNLFIGDYEKDVIMDGYQWIPLRDLMAEGTSPLLPVLEYGLQIRTWLGEFQYCGRCGTEMGFSEEERARVCPFCGHAAYPRISPAIICRVTNGDKILLARGRRFQRPFFSILAGFVEAGESLEDAVAREIREEVGIEVKNIRYFESQPWAFSSSLMIGFTAEYASGDLVLQEEEILEADWYTRENLPDLPGRYSIARKLIENWIDSPKSKGI